jgi:naphthalene 1,2-dioxygenase system ferredoxin subunit
MSQQWMEACTESELPQDDVTGVEVGDANLAMYRIDGEVFATDNICTHGRARLCNGFLEGYEIECPLHQGRFDVRSGKAMCEPLTQDLRTYPVKIEGGKVFIDLG